MYSKRRLIDILEHSFLVLHCRCSKTSNRYKIMKRHTYFNRNNVIRISLNPSKTQRQYFSVYEHDLNNNRMYSDEGLNYVRCVRIFPCILHACSYTTTTGETNGHTLYTRINAPPAHAERRFMNY